MTREEYLENYGKTSSNEAGKAVHRAYYAQFVDHHIRYLVIESFTVEALVNSKDPHFNDITLARWDRLATYLPYDVNVALKAQGDGMSLGSGVCILKEAAQQIVDAYRAELK